MKPNYNGNLFNLFKKLINFEGWKNETKTSEIKNLLRRSVGDVEIEQQMKWNCNFFNWPIDKANEKWHMSTSHNYFFIEKSLKEMTENCSLKFLFLSKTTFIELRMF